MNICLLPSSVTPDRGSYFLLTTFLIDDRVAIDAGSLGLFATPGEQAKVKHIFLSHAHIDHLASLPLFLENVAGSGEPVTVYGSASVLDCLRRDLFNGRLWPDFFAIVRDGVPLVRSETLEPGRPVSLLGLTLTPIAVNHSVPTLGYIIDDGQSAVVVVGDTAPTQEIWEQASRLPHLRAVFLEASFPDHLAELADRTGHLTPRTFAAEVSKLNRPVPVFAVHLKATYHAEIAEELKRLGRAEIEITQPGRVYTFTPCSGSIAM